MKSRDDGSGQREDFQVYGEASKVTGKKAKETERSSVH
jgi:hypothetical protein